MLCYQKYEWPTRVGGWTIINAKVSYLYTNFNEFPYLVQVLSCFVINFTSMLCFMDFISLMTSFWDDVPGKKQLHDSWNWRILSFSPEISVYLSILERNWSLTCFITLRFIIIFWWIFLSSWKKRVRGDDSHINMTDIRGCHRSLNIFSLPH